MRKLLVKLFDFFLPVEADLIVHLDCSKLIYRYDHTLTTKTSAREMIYDMLGNRVQTVITLDDLKFLGIMVFKTALLGFSQIFFFQNIGKIGIQEIILQLHFRHTLYIVKRHGGVVLDGFGKVIFADIIAKPRIGQSLVTKKRCASKRKILCVRQTIAHVFRQILILRAVRLIHDNHYVITLR